MVEVGSGDQGGGNRDPVRKSFGISRFSPGGIRHAVVRCAGEPSSLPPRELTVRKIIVPALAFLLGITITFIIRGSAVKERAVAPAVPKETTAPAPLPPPGNPGTTLSAQNVEAWQLLHEGRAHEAQDVFLGILSTDPEDQDAMRGLVAARRGMAGDDPSELRRQVAVYEDAIRRGTDTKEHYTRLAMIMLVAASERAAQEIEAPSEAASPPLPLRKSIQASTPPAVPQPVDAVSPSGKLPPPAAHPVKPSGPQTPPPTPAAKRQAAPPVSKRQTAPPRPAPAPQAVTPPPAPAPQASPPPAPAPQASPPPPVPTRPTAPPPAPAPQASTPPPTKPAPVTANPLYTVRVGPVFDRDRASAIAKQLAAGGFSPTISTQSGPVFRVVSEPLPRNVAEDLGATLAGRGFRGQLELLAGGTAQLLFGAFISQKDAEALSQRITAQGYDVWVVRGGPAYMLQLGPYPQSSVEAITGILKSGAADATVTVDPAP